MTEKLKWPYNSELYWTIGEIRKDMPKLNFKDIRASIHITKPRRPNLVEEINNDKVE